MVDEVGVEELQCSGHTVICGGGGGVVGGATQRDATQQGTEKIADVFLDTDALPRGVE